MTFILCMLGLNKTNRECCNKTKIGKQKGRQRRNKIWTHRGRATLLYKKNGGNKYDNIYFCILLSVAFLFFCSLLAKNNSLRRYLWLVRLRVSSGQERHSGRQHDACVVGIRWRSWGITVMVRVRLWCGGVRFIVVGYRFCVFFL